MFTTLFYQPILNLLVFLYDIIPGSHLALAIILMTIIIKLILLPLSNKSIKSQKALQDLQPKIKEIQNKYKNDKQAMGQAMMKLYKDNKVNPFSSCLPLLIQLPFLWAIFKVFRDGIDQNLQLIYSFIAVPDKINFNSFGFIVLDKPNIVLAILAGLAQFWQSRMLITKQPPIHTQGAKDEGMMANMNKQMLYIMPVLTVVFGMTLPGGLSLYWLTQTVFTIIQQKIMFKKQGQKNSPEKISAGQKETVSPSQSAAAKSTKIIEGEAVEVKEKDSANK